jgi:hypothetical protein
MILANDTLKNAIISPVRTITARVEFYEDSTLVHSFNYNDNLISFSIERIGEDNKFFGFGICQKANIKLIDTKRELSFTTSNSIKIGIGSKTEMIYPYPTFFITEVHRDERTNQLSITAYDLLYGAGGYTVSDLFNPVEALTQYTTEELSLAMSYSVLDFAVASAAIIGANDMIIEGVGEDETCFDTFYDGGANFGGEETIREALNDVAEATQTIYYINNNDNIVFKRLNKDSEPVLTITKADYTTLESGANRRLGGICSATELGDNVSATTEAAGTIQYVRDNAFWALRSDIANIVETALATVGGMTINQFNCSWRGNYLVEPGDKIALVTKDNNTVISYLLNDMVSYTGGFTQKTQWNYTDSEESPSNPTTIGEALNLTFARVNKIDKEIDMVASKTDVNGAGLAQIKLTTDDIVASVEEIKYTTNTAIEGVNGTLETLTQRVDAAVTAEDVKLIVQSELENGVNSITTTTGFTFNQEGLTVNKSDSEMTTKISEDGMTVYRDDTQVLVANNEGVNATNLHATTYLIIGDNSRFEDYDNNSRTGCFWIGG